MADGADTDPRVRDLTVVECWERLASHPTRIGRLATGGAAPDIVPVTYAVDNRTVVFRTGRGKKLSAIARGERVAFEVDHVEPDWGAAWSVVLRGFAEPVTDADEVDRLQRLPLRAWHPDPKPVFVRLVTRLASGREIV